MAVAQEVEQRLKACGLIPDCFIVHAKVSLGKVLNTELIPMCSWVSGNAR